MYAFFKRTSEQISGTNIDVNVWQFVGCVETNDYFTAVETMEKSRIEFDYGRVLHLNKDNNGVFISEFRENVSLV